MVFTNSLVPRRVPVKDLGTSNLPQGTIIIALDTRLALIRMREVSPNGNGSGLFVILNAAVSSCEVCALKFVTLCFCKLVLMVFNIGIQILSNISA